MNGNAKAKPSDFIPWFRSQVRPKSPGELLAKFRGMTAHLPSEGLPTAVPNDPKKVELL